jgi:hypothetical protein
MTYTIAGRAIADAETYLGDRFTEIIGLFTQSINAGEITTRRQVRFVMSFVGIQGITVDAIIDKYWPSLPA